MRACATSSWRASTRRGRSGASGSLRPARWWAAYVYGVFALAMTWFAPRGRARGPVLAVRRHGAAGRHPAIPRHAVPDPVRAAGAGGGAGAAVGTAQHRLAGGWRRWSATAPSSPWRAHWIEGQDHVALRAMRFHAQEACGGEKAMALLNALPPGRVAAFVDQGPPSWPIPRTAPSPDPITATRRAFWIPMTSSPGANPRAVLRKRGIDYLMTCRAAPDWDFYRAQGRTGGAACSGPGAPVADSGRQ